MLTKDQYESLKTFKGGLPTDGKLTEEMRYFREQKYIKPTSYQFPNGGFGANPTAWSITPAGEAALFEFEQAVQNKAEQERQQRFQNKISVLQVLIPFITFFLGLVVEHYSGLVSFLVGFFLQ